MKIQLASDLHLEHLEGVFPKYHGINPTSADVLILPGDIHRDIKAAWLFADWKVPVLYVQGNHEHYDRDIIQSCAAAHNLIGPGAVVHNYENEHLWTSSPTVRLLEETEYVQDNVRFLGCTLWTDYALIHPDLVKRCMEHAEMNIKDHHVIRVGRDPFTSRHARTRHEHNLTWLATKLSEPFDGKTVVITHHGPHYKSTHPRYAGNFLNPAFVSNLEAFILQYQPHLWVHGHVHDSFDYMVGNTRVVANPRGYALNGRNVKYPSELLFENRGFDPSLVIDV